MATTRAPQDATRAVRAAGLRYVTDSMPGIRRRRVGKGFSYRAPDGHLITDRAELARIRSLAIPPAWRDVWICPHPNGHLQATGLDARGRKQYRYHPDWRTVRDVAKFDRMLEFARALPRIRARVAEDQARRGLPREKVLATVVRLLEVTLIRVGNREYARDNRSYGLTTLRDRHVDFGGAELVFEYRGKGGKHHRITLRDRRLARIVRSCKELPGQHLFQYLDESGERRPIGSADVNAYLEEISGQPFTAKDFRTWAATVLAALALSAAESFESEAAAKRNVTRAFEQVAAQLGNTVAVCRKSYVHPEIVECYLEQTLSGPLDERVPEVLLEDLAGLRSEEVAVLALLQQRAASERRTGSAAPTIPGELKTALEQSVAQERDVARSPPAPL
ncbi:MAG TPA: DNA topoisomerase IB [Geminicoccaceae bacterium]|nr:DNA topoisomerase IB [Geminicoccaceae bacterium]